MLSIIIPLRNNYENLEEIERQFSENLINIDYEVILVNDFSEDETLLKAKQISKKNNFSILDNKKSTR